MTLGSPKFGQLLSAARVLAIVVCTGFIANAQTVTNPDLKVDDVIESNYRIGSGDVLNVLVPKNALLTTNAVRVANDGTIRLPMIDDPILARCRTEAELSLEITERLRKYLLDPQVYVTVTEFNSNPVAVGGAVNSPGRFQLRRSIRLRELMTYVNGLSPNAGRTIQILRNPDYISCGTDTAADANLDDEGMIVVAVADLMDGNAKANPLIFAGDIVQVTDSKQAYIVGNVRASTAINLSEPVTLSRAVAMAGGTAPGAQIKKIEILRENPDTFEKTEIIVNLQAIHDRETQDVMIQPNDIINVPGPGKTKKFLRDIFRAVVPTILRVPVIIP
ncbi:MAG: polysaccharide biosynthesis/export family protein [Pyrinomonadaceae bacterium]|nr:polysaccharide biosynthesis/export family protein [Pyrinomonadaceae bacterium]